MNKKVVIKKGRTREQLEAHIWQCEKKLGTLQQGTSNWYALKGKIKNLNTELESIKSFENLAR